MAKRRESSIDPPCYQSSVDRHTKRLGGWQRECPVVSRAIGLMTMIDGGKPDHKVLAVATLDLKNDSCQAASELPPHRLAMLRRYFRDYRQMEENPVEVDEFTPAATAHPVIEDSRYDMQRRKASLAAVTPGVRRAL